jgi:dihydroorotase
MSYDLLIKGGLVVDPAQGLHRVCDVAFAAGRVALVQDHISDSEATEVLEADGMVVTPGLIDLHVHAFWGASDWGIEPDPSNIAHGVTTALDAGSAGASNFPAFRKYVLERCTTRLYALLNIATIGIPSHKVGELESLRWVDVDRAIQTVRANPDHIVGLKARLGKAQAGDNDLSALKHALEAADATGKFLMIHVGNTRTPLEELASRLRPGDIVTHCFHGFPHGILDDAGRIRDGIVEAQRRGVIFDVGHGVGSFSFEIAEKALSQGFQLGNISSDLHFYSLQATVPDLLFVLSKFFCLGLSLDEVIRLSTLTAARIIGLDGRLGTLKSGAEGDATVMRLEEGAWRFSDTLGVTRESKQRLTHVGTVRAGSLYRPWLGALQTVGPVNKIAWRRML